MKVKTTIKFEYHNSRFRKLSWVEDDPQVVIEEVDGEVTKRRPATIDDVKKALRKNLSTMLREGKIRSFVDSETNKVIIIRFAEVDEVEFNVEEVK